jgi:hypothetical protein
MFTHKGTQILAKVEKKHGKPEEKMEGPALPSGIKNRRYAQQFTAHDDDDDDDDDIQGVCT